VCHVLAILLPRHGRNKKGDIRDGEGVEKGEQGDTDDTVHTQYVYIYIYST